MVLMGAKALFDWVCGLVSACNRLLNYLLNIIQDFKEKNLLLGLQSEKTKICHRTCA